MPKETTQTEATPDDTTIGLELIDFDEIREAICERVKATVALSKFQAAKKKLEAKYAAEREALAEAQAQEAVLRAEFADVYEAVIEAWLEQAEDSDAPRPELPEGFTVKALRDVEIYDPDAVPREYCLPDPKIVKKTVLAGVGIDGACEVPKYVLEYRGAK